MPHPFWPLFDLEVRTPRITLRYVDDELAVALADLAGRGIHDPGRMPFLVPWTDATPPTLQRDAFRFWWRCRAETRPAAFRLPLAVIADGVVVGASDLAATDFPVLRSFETGSWLGQAHQGRGLGRELRVATLQLGFAGFGARQATTGAFADNDASLGVTRSLGYEPAGRRLAVRRGEPAEICSFAMTRDHWERHVRRDDVELHGVDGACDLLEITP